LSEVSEISEDITYGVRLRRTNISYLSELTPTPSQQVRWLWFSGCGVNSQTPCGLTYVARRKSRLRKLSAHLMKRRLKINGFIMFCVILLIAAFPRIFLRSGGVSFFDEAMEIVGITFILLGQIFRVSARGHKSEYSKNGHLLIQGGPYALVRNPMYLGILLIGLGIVSILFQWWVICIFLLVFSVRYLLLIFKEEKKLLAMFPKDYRDYQQKVPRILPSMATISRKDISEYLPLKLSWLKREIGSILAVLLVVLLIEAGEDIKKEGVRAYFNEAIIYSVIIILFICMVIHLSRRTTNLEKDVSNKSKSN